MTATLLNLARQAHPHTSEAELLAMLAAIPTRNTETRKPVKAILRRPRIRPRREALEHRRRLARSFVMPPALGARFTEAELAVLRIVADQVRARGACDLSYDELADRAKVSRKTAKRALQAAAAERLVAIEERRRRGRPNLTNLVRIISSAWRAWLDKGGGGQRRPTLENKDSFRRPETRPIINASALPSGRRFPGRGRGADG